MIKKILTIWIFFNIYIYIMNYYKKYLKYKQKYLELKQKGGVNYIILDDLKTSTVKPTFTNIDCFKNTIPKISVCTNKKDLLNNYVLNGQNLSNFNKIDNTDYSKVNLNCFFNNDLNLLKCIEIKFEKQIDPNIDNKISGKYQTAAYVYSLNSNNMIYFSLVRKVPFGYRIFWDGKNKKQKYPDFEVKPPGKRTGQPGAAGTNYHYHGKWTNLGGGTGNGYKTWKSFAIEEILDESGIYKTHRQGFKNKLQLEYAIIKGSLGIFLFFIEDWNYFKKYYPPIDNYITFDKIKFYTELNKKMNIGQKREWLEKGSHGEIDRRVSLNTQQLFDIQKYENTNYSNNFLISYFCDTFNNYIIKFLFTKFLSYKNKWVGKKLIRLQDKFINVNQPRNRFGSRPAKIYEGI